MCVCVVNVYIASSYHDMIGYLMQSCSGGMDFGTESQISVCDKWHFENVLFLLKSHDTAIYLTHLYRKLLGLKSS